MFFTIIRPKGLQGMIVNRQSIKKYAYIKIVHYELTVSDLQLDGFLHKKYNIGLKDLALVVLAKAKIVFDNGNQYTILWRDTQTNIYAKLLMHGNGIVPGSNILREAFAFKL